MEPRDPATPNTLPSRDTVEADRADGASDHQVDRMPTPEEEADAPEEIDRETARAYKEAMERGADVRGEGEI